MDKINVQNEVNAILLDLELLKRSQQSVIETIKSYIMHAEGEQEPKFHAGDEVRFELDPDLIYQVESVIWKRYGFAYSISPVDEKGITIVAIDEKYLSAL